MNRDDISTLAKLLGDIGEAASARRQASDAPGVAFENTVHRASFAMRRMTWQDEHGDVEKDVADIIRFLCDDAHCGLAKFEEIARQLLEGR